MERLMVMKGLLSLLFPLSSFSLLVLCICSLLSCFLLFSVLVLFPIPGAPLSYNVIE
jgi:hypothetical protein